MAFIRSLQTALNIHPSDSLGYNNNNVIKTFMIGKKVEVSLRLFDIFERNMDIYSSSYDFLKIFLRKI